MAEEEDDDEAKEQRAEYFRERTVVPSDAYPEMLEAAVAHALAVRPAPVAPLAQWVSVGPRNVAGKIIALAQDPKNRLILCAGSAHGGVWITRNGGDTWAPLGVLGLDVPVGAIAFDSQNSNTLYVGTGFPTSSEVGGRGLYRVTLLPAGAVQLVAPDAHTVTPRNARPGAAHRYTRIRVDPEVTGRFWAASQTGLWRFEPITNAFVREFPLGNNPPEGTQLTNAPVPGPSDGWPDYATDLLVATDPRSDERFVTGGREIGRYVIVFVSIHGVGVFRGRFDRVRPAQGDWTVAWDSKLGVAPSVNFGRIRLAQCENKLEHVFAIFNQTSDNKISNVFRSSNHGGSWTQGATNVEAVAVSDNSAEQGHYNLVLEVHPDRPDVVLCGAVDLFLSTDKGDHWTQILDWNQYNNGDYAQHADQHASLLDRSDRRAFWIGNDGGISATRDLRRSAATPHYWRKRSHGINVAQFYDLAVSSQPALTMLSGGGLQDNGTFVGYGGSTWYNVGGGDGGMMAFHNADPRVNLTSTQRGGRASRVQVGGLGFLNPVVHDVAVPAGVPASTMALTRVVYPTPAPGADLDPPFVGMQVQDPTTPGRLLIGWTFESTTPTELAYWANSPALGPPLVAPAAVTGIVAAAAPPPPPPPPPMPSVQDGEETSALTFSAQYSVGAAAAVAASPADAWIGTNRARLFLAQVTSAALGAFAPVPVAPPFPGGLSHVINSIRVNPNDQRIVVVCAAPDTSWYRFKVTTAGGIGGAAPARFTLRPYNKGTALGPFSITGATFQVPGRALFLSFRGNFAVNDEWALSADGDSWQVAGSNADHLSSVSAHSATLTVQVTTPGAVGTADLSVTIGNHVIAGIPVRAEVAITGTLTTLFCPAGAYAAGDTWTIAPGDVVTARVGNTSPAIQSNTRRGGSVFITYDKGNTWTDLTRGPLPRVSPDLTGLPPCTVASVLLRTDTPHAELYAGTLVGIYRHADLPMPTAIAIAANPVAAPPINVPPGGTLRLSANVTLSAGAPVMDWAAQVDWSTNNANVQVVDGLLTATPAAAAGPVNVFARRGTVVSLAFVVTVAAGAAVAPPPRVPFSAPNLAVSWRPFNNGLPLTLVNDMEMLPGTTTLRAATFGRGVWDAHLAANPFAGPLHLRQWVIEDGRTFPRMLPVALRDDPRLPPGTGLDLAHAFDIRVDAPQHTFFDDRVDGVEFDERGPVDRLAAGQVNAIYVQVQNRGTAAVANVDVHLYFQPAANIPIGAPVAVPPAPPLPALPPVTVAPAALPAALGNADFVNPPSYDPPVGSVWTRIGPRAQRIASLQPGEPQVVRFDFVAPAPQPAPNDHIALIALCTAAADAVPAGPVVTINTLINNERRAALRIVPLGAAPRAAIHLRDSVEDDGITRGWSPAARHSPDVIVVEDAPADPRTAFRDLLDPRRLDRIRPFGNNNVFIRVHNRGNAAANCNVEVWAIPLLDNHTPDTNQGNWQRLTPAPPAAPLNVPVPARDWALTPAIAWNAPGDPTPADPTLKAYLLLALAQTADNVDPLPAVARATSPDELWALVMREGDQDNVALRGLRYE